MSPHTHRRSFLSRRRRVVLGAAVAVAAGALVVPTVNAATTPATSATPSAKRLHDDYNGDGYPDLAIGAPGTTADGHTKAGAISVVYGAAGGLSTSRKQVLTWPARWNSVNTLTGYGTQLQSADLDEDGYADLLSSVAMKHFDGYSGKVVVVNWGGPKGLSAEPAMLTGMPDAMHMRGFTVADVDGDKHPDLVRLGVDATSTDPQGQHGAESVTADGAVRHGPFTRDRLGTRTTYFDITPGEFEIADIVTSGDVNGDGIADIAVSTHSTEESDSRGVALLTGGADGFTNRGLLKDTTGRLIGGEDLAIGDLNKDGYGDIVVGHSFDNYDSDVELPTKGGALGVAYGDPGGLSTTRKPVWINQDTAGVPGAGEHGDGMGTGLSIGDTDGDGYLDVATGLPNEDLGSLTDAGSVLVLRGSAKGLTGTGAKVFTQDTAGVPGTAEKQDRFGTETALLDANGDKKDGLIVGDADENAGNGSVWILSATASGITASGASSFGATTLGLPATGSRFGQSLND
ncbi:FG-GAP-like repeat-containing protein [Streptomyces sp. NPDC005813]|uniref:FG-GAP-like repeat-containing protein n=1 Tax=Streptomyces sp. NPDC005813 TaxID=3155592 RepID=UPI0033D6CB76